MPARRVPLVERFFAKVDRSDGCWLWTGALTGAGYPAIGAGAPSRRMLMAHRVSYEIHVGPIPEGLQIDHLCRNPRCVNPDHLEPVTPRENLRRSDLVTGLRSAKKRCPAGHPYDAENTQVRNGRRHCRACARELWRRRNDRRTQTSG